MVLGIVGTHIIELGMKAVECGGRRVARNTAHHILPVAISERIAELGGSNRLVVHPAHAPGCWHVALQDRQDGDPVKEPVLLLRRPFDAQDIHDGREEIQGDDWIPAREMGVVVRAPAKRAAAISEKRG